MRFSGMAFGAEGIDLAVQVLSGCSTAGNSMSMPGTVPGGRLCPFGMKVFRIWATARKPEGSYGSAVSLHVAQTPWSSTLCETAAKPCSRAVRSAQRSTVVSVTSTV
jgi:hypothetical protein